MIRIITIEREFGSGGGVIAEKVAARLGWKLWDQLLTEEIARRLDCDCVLCRIDAVVGKLEGTVVDSDARART